MFTGLISELGEVVSFNDELLKIKAKHKPKLGDSIAINGACLTVVEFDNMSFCVQLSHESKANIACENLKNKVHIEPAMQLSSRLDGHLVQGHIDGIGVIKSIKKYDLALDFIILIPKNLQPLMMPKGSVCIDGVSLTINEVQNQSIRLTIIPHTYKNTLFQSYQINQRVNIESDMFARYIYNILHPNKNLTWDEVDKIMSIY